MQKSCWVIKKTGSMDNLSLEQFPDRPLEKGKIRIETKAIGLNFADIFAITGFYSATPVCPFVPGLEFSGIVTDINAESDFRPGDKVMGATRFGGYSSCIDIEPEYCAGLFEDWSFAEGASFMVQTLTAWYALKYLGNFNKDQTVLISSAAGGVGLQAMRICRNFNINPIGTVGNETKKIYLYEHGFNRVVVRKSNFRDQLAEMLDGRLIDLALDAIGGKIQKNIYDFLAPMGRLVVFGAAEYTPKNSRPNYLHSLIKYLKRPKYDPMNMVEKNRSVMGFNLIWLWDHKNLLENMMEEIGALKLSPPHIDKEFPFDKIKEAVYYLKSGRSIGKVIVTL